MFKAKVYDDGWYAHFLLKGCWVQNWCRTIEHVKQKVKKYFCKISKITLHNSRENHVRCKKGAKKPT